MRLRLGTYLSSLLILAILAGCFGTTKFRNQNEVIKKNLGEVVDAVQYAVD